ncbi:putative secreted protein (Por secretion system target) [Jejuia pallidilutea]|uniref:Putative secreted protein (Por secretion system target) n=1 Tax=Jejuia pallidilutea TaxID=504487 RepID=A0A362XD21_9FLAO|nr:carbohydrate-binding protein [Jejuia pallidilutea]PQV49013.1 putative secreted protein (Por secretion system target) [Jejuia pallidilutea]
MIGITISHKIIFFKISKALFVVVLFASSFEVIGQSITVNSTNYKQTIDMIGGDMERSSKAIQNAQNKEDILQWSFGDINFNVCRVQYDKNQELVEGVKNWAFYDKQVATMQAIKAINPNIKFFATMRSDYDGYGDDNNMPDWIHTYSTKATNVVKYGIFLADYCEYMSNQGVPIAILSTAKEWMWHVRASEAENIINTLNTELDNRGIEKPIIIDQGFWSITAGLTYLNDVQSLGTKDLYSGFCSHNYSNLGPEKWAEISNKANSLGKPMYDDETSTGSGSPTYGEERPMWKQIDEYKEKAQRYEAGLSGEVYFEIWSRGIDKETRAIYFPANGIGTRLRGYYIMKHFSNNILNYNYLTASVTSASNVYTITFRKDDNIVLWVINESNTEYTLPITMDNSSITSAIATHYWTDNTPIEGKETSYIASGNTFIPIVEAESMNCYIFNVTEDAVDVCSLPQTILYEAECYDDMQGVSTEVSTEGTDNVTLIENGDWIKFNAIDFSAGLNKFSARVASNTSGGTIEMRMGSVSGTLIGELSVSNTGGWQSWTTQTFDFNRQSGVQDLYLVFTGNTGSLFNLNWIMLEAIPPSISLNITAGDESVSLNWTTSYVQLGTQNIYRNTSSDIGTRSLLVADVSGNSYIDTSVTNDTTYWYWVEAIDESSTVTNSEGVEGTPTDLEFDLTGVAISDTEINLSWPDEEKVESGFLVERKEGNSAYQEIANLGPNVFSFSDSGLNPLSTYTYRVKASYTDGSTNYSLELPITTFNTDYETLIFNTTEDAYVRGGDHAGLNFGGDTNLIVKQGSNSSFFRKSLLKFNLSSEDLVNDNIGRAVLKLYVNQANPCTITASEITDSWSESTVTWNSAPSSGSDIGAIDISNTTGFYELDVTAYVKNQFDDDKIISISIEDFGASNVNVLINSKEATNNIPELVINKVDYSALSISKHSDLNTINIYPNPVSNTFRVSNSLNSEVVIYNLFGNQVLKTNITQNNQSVNIDHLTSGVYFVRVKKHGNQTTTKIVKN